MDLLEELGVVLPTSGAKDSRGVEVGMGHKPPKVKPQRFTEWSNATSFTFGGYLARVRRVTCECCDRTSEVFEGVFTEEIGPGGSRRLQQLGKGAQWPASGNRLEIVEEKSVLCALCVRDIGFDKEVVQGDKRTLVIREG